MKLEEQVSSLELSKRLKELGVKQESYFRWDSHSKVLTTDKDPECISAFTCSELGEMLPNNFLSGRDGNEFVCCFNQNEERDVDQKFEDCFLDTWEDDREVNARAKMLIHLIESGLVKNTGEK